MYLWSDVRHRSKSQRSAAGEQLMDAFALWRSLFRESPTAEQKRAGEVRCVAEQKEVEERNESAAKTVRRLVRVLQAERGAKQKEPKKKARWKRIHKVLKGGNAMLGMIPYHAKVKWGMSAQKKDGYRLSKVIPRVTVEAKALDWIWEGRVYREAGKTKAEIHKPSGGQADINNISINWTTAEGWTAVDNVTGRRTRPMSRIMGAVACITLVWVYPEMLQLTLEHAKASSQGGTVYWVLLGATVMLVGLIGWYIWLAYKTQPSGFEHMLTGLGKMLEKSKENGEQSKQEGEEQEPEDGGKRSTEPSREAEQGSTKSKDRQTH